MFKYGPKAWLAIRLKKNKLAYICFLKLNLCNNYIQMKQKRVNGRFANAKGKNKRNKCLTRQEKGKYIA